MVPTTKEAERAELHKTIWRIANDLRGSVDGWDFKQYVLGMLFYRYISENLAADIVGHEKPRITYGLYSGGASLETKAEALGRVSYPGL